MSAKNGRMEMVKYLVELGADIHAENEYALRWSAKHGHLEIVKYLVELGAEEGRPNKKKLAEDESTDEGYDVDDS